MQTVKIIRNKLMPFATRTTTKRGRWLSENYFDVPAQTYSEGWTTGLEAAAQFMDAVRDGQFHCNTISVLEEVVKARNERVGDEDRVGAATAFLRMIEAMLNTVARDYDCGSWIRDQRAEHDRSHAEWREKEQAMRAAQTAAFVARMKQAKQAKREARA